MKTSRDNKILEMYYECALKEVADQKEEIEYLKNKLVEASRRIQELEGENLIWTQRCSKAEGKLNRAKNIIAKLKSFDEDLEVFLDTYTQEGLPETSLGVYDLRLEKYDKIDKQYVSILYDYPV